MKSSNKEVASKKLDDEMDAYWEQKGKEGDSEPVDEGNVGEGNEETKETGTGDKEEA